MIKKGLGRGINALLSIYDDENEESLNAEKDVKTHSNENVKEIKGLNEVNINDIMPNPNQPRKHFDETALNELAASIRVHGIIQPIVLNESGNIWLLRVNVVGALQK